MQTTHTAQADCIRDIAALAEYLASTPAYKLTKRDCVDRIRLASGYSRTSGSLVVELRFVQSRLEMDWKFRTAFAIRDASRRLTDLLPLITAA